MPAEEPIGTTVKIGPLAGVGPGTTMVVLDAPPCWGGAGTTVV